VNGEAYDGVSQPRASRRLWLLVCAAFPAPLALVSIAPLALVSIAGSDTTYGASVFIGMALTGGSSAWLARRRHLGARRTALIVVAGLVAFYVWLVPMLILLLVAVCSTSSDGCI
jgi:hypothetical protein